MSWYLWLILSGVFLIVEIMTVGFLIFWLSIGSLFAMITSFFTKNLTIQFIVFIVSSTILIFATKPFVKKFAKNNNSIKTNVYSFIDKVGIVTEDINPIEGKGQIKISGESWSALSEDNKIIPKGTKIKVIEIRGVKAIVKSI